MGWSTVCDCDTSWSYSLTFWLPKEQQQFLEIRVSCVDFNILIQEILNNKIEPVHEISNNVVYATSKASNQPVHTHSLIRAFAGRLSIL